MQFHDLAPEEGSRKKRKRVGRGLGSGMGKTSTRGHKGLKARSGGSVRPGFEGGQMPIYRRLPKRGFKNYPFKTNNAVLNIRDLDRFEDGATIDELVLRDVGLVKGKVDGVKILGEGDLSKKFSLINILVSKTAKEKIESAGGTIEMGVAVEAKADAAPAEETAETEAPAVAADAAPAEEAAADETSDGEVAEDNADVESTDETKE